MKSPHIWFDLKKLKDLKTLVDTLANSLVLLSTAEEVLRRQRKKIQTWVTNKVLDVYAIRDDS